VARAAAPDLYRALAEVKHKLIEQIEDQRSRRDPKDNRLLRKKPT